MTFLAVTARLASPADLPELVRLYGLLEDEMASIHPMWSRADGLAEPVADALAGLVDDPDTVSVLGELDGLPFGFMTGRCEPLVDEERSIGALRFVFVEFDARGVGLGEAMRDLVLAELRARGITLFDAHVLPGHRLVKNFFEAGGFSARSIVMHHDDDRVR